MTIRFVDNPIARTILVHHISISNLNDITFFLFIKTMTIEQILKSIGSFLYYYLSPYCDPVFLKIFILFIQKLLYIPLSIMRLGVVFCVQFYYIFTELWTNLIMTPALALVEKYMSVTQTEFFYLFSWSTYEKGRGGMLIIYYILFRLFFYLIRQITIHNINKIVLFYRKYPKPFSFIRKTILLMLLIFVCNLWFFFIFLFAVAHLIDQFFFQLLITFNYPLIILMILFAIFFFMI